MSQIVSHVLSIRPRGFIINMDREEGLEIILRMICELLGGVGSSSAKKPIGVPSRTGRYKERLSAGVSGMLNQIPGQLTLTGDLCVYGTRPYAAWLWI